jgi:hypothetical protein
METKRKRGAQPGNQNALKHGFYSRAFRQLEMSDLQSVLAGLEGEIQAMRIFTRRVLDLADGVDDLKTAIQMLYALGTATNNTASLLKVHSKLSGDGGMAEALSQAIREVLEEKRKEGRAQREASSDKQALGGDQ